MTAETQMIMIKLDAIKSEVDYIKEHMLNADAILSEDDRAALAAAEEEYRKGKTIKLENLKKELGL